MKILHTSDWHLGKKLENFSRIEEQKEVLDEIVNIANNEKVDATIIAGDIFDSYNPSVEAEYLYYRTLKKLSNNGNTPVIVIAGNHDSPDRIDAPKPLAMECGIIVIGQPYEEIPLIYTKKGFEISKIDKGFLEIIFLENDIPLRLVLFPYANELRLKEYFGIKNSDEKLNDYLQEKWNEISQKYLDNNGINILASHILMAKSYEKIPEEPEGEKPILKYGGENAFFVENLPENLHYIALGHLHRFQMISENVVYSGSPLAYSLSEAGQDKFVVIIEFDNEVKIKPIKLQKSKKIYRKKFSSISEAENWLKENPDCLVEITIKTDKFISSKDRKILEKAHNGIIAIIPEIEFEEKVPSFNKIDLTKDIKTLFIDFFKKELSQEPNEEIIELFKEVLSRRN